jgi:hypothetical protein
MRVIKEGNGSAWTKEILCTGKGNNKHGCGALLEVGGNDLFRTYNSWYDGSSENYITFECPLCKAWTDIGTSWNSDVPSDIKKTIMNMEPRYQGRNTVSNDPL